MTENEAIKELSYDNTAYGGRCTEEVRRVAIHALSEIQKYKELGTVEEILKVFNNQRTIIATQHETLKQYREIGTIEEFKALKEKMQDVEIAIIDRMQEFYDEYRSISQSSVDHFGGKANAIETSQSIVKGVFKDILGIDWSE